MLLHSCHTMHVYVVAASCLQYHPVQPYMNTQQIHKQPVLNITMKRSSQLQGMWIFKPNHYTHLDPIVHLLLTPSPFQTSMTTQSSRWVHGPKWSRSLGSKAWSWLMMKWCQPSHWQILFRQTHTSLGPCHWTTAAARTISSESEVNLKIKI